MLEPISPQSPHTVKKAAFTQRWNDLSFLHWRVDPALVAPLLPAGTTPDLEDGTTWVGLIPFEMSHVGVFGTPPIPYLSRFPETNVRLYARDDRGRRGVVFRSLEAGRLLPVLAAITTYHLPYKWARMSIERVDGSRCYRSSRRWPGPRPASSRVQVRIGERIEGDALAHFLTARWGMFSTWYGDRTVWAPVDHAPWPLHSAELEDLDEDLVERAGISELATGQPHVMWSPGVSVRIGRPVLL
ncbi:MAG TPA: DUF2071 domain-containing protein [Mycobacteriales bacterium]|nr:DUF2071 domain-containing protein [Mycobacteriales bacterium]